MILQSENPIRMLRELRGAPLSIVLALSMMHQRVSQGWLESTTGYTDKPVSQALAYLREVGLADHTSAGWQLIKENARQLPIVMEITAEVNTESAKEAEESEDPEDTEEVKETKDPLPPPPNKNQFRGGEESTRNNSDSLLTYLNNNNNNIINNQVSKVINGEKRKISDLDPQIEDNLETFRELGIKINRRTSNLARMKHITRDYITGTVSNLKQGELLGLAIIRMEQGDGGEKPKKHKSGCGCDECRKRYGEWER